jgi:dextranase
LSHSRLDYTFVRSLRNYYDFIVRYSKILFDKDLRDVSMIHCSGDNQEYIFENLVYSTYGEPGKVWTIIREKDELKIISLTNLTNNSEDLWNRGKQIPYSQKDIIVKVQILKVPKYVYTVSPDKNFCRPIMLKYKIEDSNRGRIMTVIVPEVHIWSILVMEF